jgi:hypothetical protein
MHRRRFCVGMMLVTATGCSPDHLRDMTVATTATLSDMQYQMVLDNLAMMATNPDLIPWHAKLDSGTIQLNDEVAGSLGIAAIQVSKVFDWVQGSAMFTPRRQRTHQWDIIPVTNPKELRDLQAAYQQALGFETDKDLLTTFKVPTGWLGKGTRQDVPATAPYVGHYRDQYVWAMPENVKSLSKLTLIVLSIVEFKSGERYFNRAVISTPR